MRKLRESGSGDVFLVACWTTSTETEKRHREEEIETKSLRTERKKRAKHDEDRK